MVTHFSSAETMSQLCLYLDAFRVLDLPIHFENGSIPDGAAKAHSSSSAERCIIWSG